MRFMNIKKIYESCQNDERLKILSLVSEYIEKYGNDKFAEVKTAPVSGKVLVRKIKDLYINEYE